MGFQGIQAPASIPVMKVTFRIFLGLILIAARAHAFSLLGPYEGWMQQTNGFRYSTDIGGPMNLGEEYRWNVPVLTYAFDQSFLDYFGTNGVTAVEQAIQILNDLPPVSQLDPTNYPPEASRVNYIAQALGLVDLKSQTLHLLLEQLGLAAPSGYTYCMRSFTFIGGTLQTAIIQRNFDPIYFTPSVAVNDSEYNYSVSLHTNGLQISAIPIVFLLDPLDTSQPAIADGSLIPSPGGFFTGLTRDDVGGLRYLLRTNNNNLEALLPGVHGVGTNAGNFVNQAVRPGVDKVTFVRRDYDALFGQFFPPYTNQFTDAYVTNNALGQQQLERVVTEPDFLFSVTDAPDGNVAPLAFRTGTTNWWNGGLPGLAGPGVIRPPIGIKFNKLSPGSSVWTSDSAPNEPASFYNTHWASFDNSTNPPVIYPNGLSLITNQLTVRFWLHNSPRSKPESSSWSLPVSIGGHAVLLAATNLTDWVSLGSVTNRGGPVDWHHIRSLERRFFRVVPE
jgi:hypothetical protein